MKYLFVALIFCVAFSLKAQDTTRHYSPSITLAGGWVNNRVPHIEGGNNLGLNVYLPIGNYGNGIELMGGYQSNSIDFIPYGSNPMTGYYFIPCFYFTVPIKKVALIFHLGAGIEGVRIPDEITTYQFINFQTITNSYEVQYYTRCIDANVGLEVRYYAYKGLYAGIQIEGLYRSQIIPNPPSIKYGSNNFYQFAIVDWIFNFCIGYKL
jgi:hypothetical protein